MLVRSVCACMRVRVEKAEHRKIFVMTFSSDISVFFPGTALCTKRKKIEILCLFMNTLHLLILELYKEENVLNILFTRAPLLMDLDFFPPTVQEKTFNSTPGGSKFFVPHSVQSTESISAVSVLAR